MDGSKLRVFIAIYLILIALLAIIVWQRHDGRPANVPATAVLLDDTYLDCPPSQFEVRFGQPCKVYDRTTGKVLDADPFAVRLKAFSNRHAGSVVDCGRIPMRTPDDRIAECVRTAFKNRKPFAVQYFSDFGFMTYAYGLTGDAGGNIAMATYDSRGFPNVRPTRRTELLDGNRVRLTPCVAPINLGTTDDGAVACIPAINEQASASAARQQPIDTTICAIADNPPAFNNRLVRVRGHVSGNFEYSILSGDGCSDSLWFAYGSDEAPPGLVAHVGGAAASGGEDEEDKRILPVPVSLLRDRNFDRFQRLMRLRTKQDERLSRLKPDEFISHQVTATFVGRIDAVSPEVHQFHALQHSESRQADYLGFGHMGLFDAQLIMQSVQGGAVLEKKMR